MKLRAFFAVFLCLAVLLSALPASAAQLIPPPSSVSLTNLLPVAQVWASSSAMPIRQIYTVSDNDPTTAWNAADGGIDAASSAYLMLSLASPATVTDIWIRNGFHASAADYAANGYPSQVTVHLWRILEGGGNVQAAQYSYQLHDAYLPNVYADQFFGGYQRLALPVALDNIISIVINIDQWQQQGTTNAVMISDVAICGASANYPSTITPEPPVYHDRDIYAVLNQKIATRTGPGTEYTEPGTFLSAGDTVQVISLTYDDNGVPWVQVDFTAYGAHRRAYTGLKRLNISADMLPEEHPLNMYAELRQDVTPRCGPGRDYLSHKDVTLYAGESAVLIAQENDWLLLEIDRPGEPLMRVWVEERYVSW